MKRRHQAGFATITAIILIGLAGLAVSAVATLFITDMQRTRELGQDAQMRQLLLAALHVPPPERGATVCVLLPAELGLRHAQLTMQTVAADDQSCTVRVEARLEKRLARQVLVYGLSGGQWRLQSAELE